LLFVDFCVSSVLNAGVNCNEGHDVKLIMIMTDSRYFSMIFVVCFCIVSWEAVRSSTKTPAGEDCKF